MNTLKDSLQESWLADAAKIDVSIFDLEKYIAITPQIDDFISSNKYIVAAPKGYGKTLLLKYRRLGNIEKYSGQEVLMIPTNSEIDLFDNAIPFDDHFKDFLKSQAEWENLWQVSIGFSLIVNYAIAIKDYEFISEFLDSFKLRGGRLSFLASVLGKISARIKEKTPIPSYIKIQTNPSSVLASLLTSSLSDLRACLAGVLDLIHQWSLAIDRPAFLYVDQIDQGVKEFPPDLWRNAQNGIVGAIFRLHNPNKHIKVYASIRSEAWDSCKSELYSQYKDYVSTITYVESDLRLILEHAVRTYEVKRFSKSPDDFKNDPIRTFVGLDKVTNHWGYEEEDVFKYMLRHSLRRPRDLILLGGGVHALYKENHLTEEDFRSLVNRNPGEEIGKQYLLETLKFTECLGNVNLQRFFSLTQKNVFTLDEMIEICSRYNSGVECRAKGQRSNHSEACLSCNSANHIFCDLYRIGLLGIVKSEEIKEDKSRYQYFKTPGHIHSEHLPSSSFYVLHPAMDYFIKEELSNNLFSPVRGVIVGQGRKWTNKYDALIILSKIDDALKSCGVIVSPQVLATYKEIVEDVAGAGSANKEGHVVSKGRIDSFKKMISSDGLISATQFVANIFGSLEKLQAILK